MILFLQQILNGFVVGSIYALFALGFTLIFGVLRILNLAHGAIFMWGAFAGLYACDRLGMPLMLVFPAAMCWAGVLSLVLDWLAFRPLRKKQDTEFAPIVSSIGAGLILISLAQRFSNTKIMRFPFNTFPVRIYEYGGLRISLLQITIMLSAAVVVVCLILLVFKTSFGRQLRAVAISERTASLLGVSPRKVYALTFFISGALAGLAGVLIGLSTNSVHFLMGEAYMLKAFVIVVLGGLGSVGGAIVGGLALGLLHTMVITYISSDLSDAIIFGLLFAVLLWRPSGLFGTIRQEGRIMRA